MNECTYACAMILWGIFWLNLGLILGYVYRAATERKIL